MVLFLILLLGYSLCLDKCSEYLDCETCIRDDNCGWYSPSEGGKENWKFSCVKGNEWNCLLPECTKPHIYYHDFCPRDLEFSTENRRSIRKYLEVPISKDLIHELVVEAQWAPSCDDYEPWRYYLIQNKELLKNISDFVHRGFDIFHGAPAALFMFVEAVGGCEYAKDIDGSLALQNFMLSAYNYGLGTCCIGQARGSEPIIREILKIPEVGYHYVLAVALGHPAEKNEMTRKPPKLVIVE